MQRWRKPAAPVRTSSPPQGILEARQKARSVAPIKLTMQRGAAYARMATTRVHSTSNGISIVKATFPYFMLLASVGWRLSDRAVERI